MFMSKAEKLVPVNQWQADMFQKYGISNRDPMFQTMATLFEIARFKTEVEIVEMTKVPVRDDYTSTKTSKSNL